MSAKKKSAAKKSVKKATKKSTAKKASTKKASTKKAASKVAAKKTSSKSTVKATGSTTKKASSAKSKPSTKSDSAPKVTSKPVTRIAMGLEEIRELLKKRAKEEAAILKEKKATATAPVASKKIDSLDSVEIKNSRHEAASLDDILGIGSPMNQQQKVPKKWKKFYDLLIELRDEVRAELNQHSSDTLKRSQKEDSGEVVTSSDAGTDTFDRDFALSLLSSEQEALNEIESAINRIHRGTYGTCEETGEPISEERLEAVPFTRFSLEGKKLHEMNSQRKVQRSGAFLNEVDAGKISFGDDDGDN